MEKWRLIIEGEKSPSYNMAADEFLLDQVGSGQSIPTIRLYRWDPPTISIGYFQKYGKEIDLEKVKRDKIGFVRRITGGRAVFHYDELTYSIVSKTQGLFSESIMENYKRISELFLKTFESMGYKFSFEKQQLSKKELKQESSPCFLSKSKYELTNEGKKFIGSAQVVRKKTFLQHGSIKLNDKYFDIVNYMPDTVDKEKLLQLLKNKTASFEKSFKEKLNFKDFTQKFVENIETLWNINIRLTVFEDHEIKEIEDISKKYKRQEWNCLR